MKKIVFIIGAIALCHVKSFGQTDTLHLHEVEVLGGEAARNLTAAQMGRVSISDKMILKLPVMFGEPDIIKTLQTLPGVSQGVEGFTGLYVRGGDNDHNLFLYQGLPLYHVSHLGGIFSSFNVSTVRNVEFYKSSFPAYYGGRISSITDVSMKNPDFEKFTGRFSLGLLSGNAYISGPLAKDKTAFSIGLRRSWIDLVSIPTLAIMNEINKKDGKKNIAQYAFTDFNARIDHKFNNRASAYIVGYYGHDNLKIGERLFESRIEGNVIDGEVVDPGDIEDRDRFFDEDVNKLSWGNWGILGAFDYRLGNGFINASAYYSSYSSSYRQEKEYHANLADPSTYGYNRSRTDNGIDDIAINAYYLAEFGKSYLFRGGAGFIHHDYLPEGLVNESEEDGKSIADNNGSPHVAANEAYIYIDNTFNITDRVALNAGLRVVAYRIQSHSHNALEPRASVRIRLSQDYSLKAGYARMSQFAQQVSSNYINLPTDLWQPITARFKPLQSDQYSLGVYGNLPYSMYFSVEGWYKDMQNLLEYREGISSLNPDLAWEEKMDSGKGWSYGLDLSITKTAGKITGSAGYGLMWNWRKFDELNQGEKFPAKFDNRHKININANYHLNEKIEFNAGWTLMTGNRLTLSLYNYDMPGNLFPDAPSVNPSWNEHTGVDYYSGRNNIRMPAYHRLDLGMSIHKKMRNGRTGTWNFGLYNAYCRMNPITIKKDDVNKIWETDKDNWHRTFKTLSFIPVIPSVSYTYSF